MPMKKFDAPAAPRKRTPAEIRARGKANLMREAKRQTDNEKRLDRIDFTGEDVKRVASDKEQRAGYGEGTRHYMTPRLQKSRKRT